MIVREHIEFERGRNPKSVMGIGLEGYLKGNSLKDKVYPASNPRRAAAELASEFMYDIDLSQVYYLGRLDVRKISDSPEWALKRLLPYIIDENQSSRRETGAGTVIRVYDTPYGKVVFEGIYGMPRYGTAWAEKDTVENLFHNRKINESIDFERGVNPKAKMGLGLVTLEFQFMNVLYDDEAWEDGIYQFDIEDPDTAETVKDLKDIGVKYEIIPDLLNDDQPDIRFTGTREQLAKVCELFYGESWKDFLEILKKWDGKSEREFFQMVEDELGY